MGPGGEGRPVRRVGVAAGKGPPVRKPAGAGGRGEKRLRRLRPHGVRGLSGEKIRRAVRPVTAGAKNKSRVQRSYFIARDLTEGGAGRGKEAGGSS